MVRYTKETLLADILAARVDAALAGLAAEAELDGYGAVVNRLLEPVLERSGDMWSRGEISLAQGYVAGKIAETVLDRTLVLSGTVDVASPKGTVILGNIEDDFHVLGRRMVKAFSRLAGWDVVDLGNDVLAHSFVDAALERGARVIGVSAMMLTTAMNIISIREEIERRGLRGLRLAVGGAVFRMRPELVAEVGGDGTAASATDAPALFDRLQSEAGS